MSFKYADESGNEVRIEPSIIRESCRVITQDLDLEESACVVIPRENVPSVAAGIAAAMHCSVDLQAPIILQPPRRGTGQLTLDTGGVTVDRGSDPARRVELGVNGVIVRMYPDAALDLAAHLAVSASEEESGLASVRGLARLISMYGASEESGQAAARAILSRCQVEERAS